MDLAGNPNWRDGLGTPKTIEGQQTYEVVDPSLIYDTVISVLDPDSEHPILYQRRFQNQLLWPIQPGLLASSQQTDLGFYQVDLFTATIRSDESGPRRDGDLTGQD